MPIRTYRPETRAPSPARAPQISLAVAGDTSGAEKLGSAIAGHGLRLEQADQARALNDARLAMTEGLGKLNRELSEDTDFATMNDRYKERLDALHKGIFVESMNPNVRQAAELEFARARVGAEATVLGRKRELEGSHVRATLSATLRSTANAIPVAGSAQEAEMHYSRATSAIAEMVDAGFISAEEGERYRQSLDGDVSTALVLDAINTDPGAAASALEEPAAYGLDETDRQRFLATARRAADARDRAQVSKLGQRVDTARAVLVRGGVVAPDEMAALQQEVAGTDFEPALKAAVDASEQLGRFAMATPAERAAFLEQVREKGISLTEKSYDEAFLGTLEAIDKHVTTALKDDPVHFAIDQDMEGAAPIDLGNQRSVQSRMALVQELVNIHGAAPRVFTKTERRAFKEIANNGSPEEQLAFVVSVMEGFGAASEAVFREIDGLDPVVQRAGELVFETGDTEVAGIILNGRVAMTSGDELRAPSEEALEIFEQSIDGVLGAVPGRRENIVEASKAYYAAMAPGRVRSARPREQAELLREAVQRVTGAVEIDGRTYGGIQDVNGKRVRLPATLDARATERMFDDATAEMWASASLSGKGPMEGDAVVMPRYPVLQWVRGSIYRVGTQSRRGEVEWYQDAAVDNGFYYVDLSQMAETFLRAEAANGN